MIATTLEARIPDKHVIQKDFAFLPLPVGCGMVAKFDDLQLKKKMKIHFLLCVNAAYSYKVHYLQLDERSMSLIDSHDSHCG